MTQREEEQKLGRYRVPDVGELLDGRYRIKGVMATGGMGMILRAEQLPMERPVAIKLLHPHIAADSPELVGRFQREVRLAKKLNHPNTIRLYDFGESEEGLVYVAMEYLEGADLKELLADEGALTVGRALEITRQMLDGLAEAHAKAFIHRDLKPSNVFVTQTRRGDDLVKILDFGIAKSLEGGRENLTATGSVCGTPSYVAPEYLLEQEPGKPADIYAVGLMLIEMLTGRKAFRGDAPVQTLMMQIKLEAPIPPALADSPIGPVIRRATSKAPEDRYADAEQMYDAVCEAMEQAADTFLEQRITDRPLARSVPAERAEAETAGSLEIPPKAAASDGRTGLSGRWVAAFVAVIVAGWGALFLLDPGPPVDLGEVDRDFARASSDGTAWAAPASSAHQLEAAEETAAAAAGADGAQSPRARAQSQAYRFEVHSDPSGARVTVDGREVGRAPIDVDVEPRELPVEVEFELDGHRPASRTLTRTSSPIVVEMLEEKRRRKPRAKRRGQTSAKRKGETSAKRKGDTRTNRRERSPAANAEARARVDGERHSSGRDASERSLSDDNVEQVVDRYLLGSDSPSSSEEEP